MSTAYRKICIFLIAIHLGLLPSCKGCHQKKEAPLPTSSGAKAKFLTASKWLPKDPDFVLSVDTYTLTQTELWHTVIEPHLNALPRLGRPPIDPKKIGLIAMAINVDGGNKVVGVMEGEFDSQSVIKDINNALGGTAGLKEEKYLNTSIYYDTNTSEYALSPLDGGLILFGDTESVKEILKRGRQETQTDSGVLKILTQDMDWGAPILLAGMIPAEAGGNASKTTKNQPILAADLENTIITARVGVGKDLDAAVSLKGKDDATSIQKSSLTLTFLTSLLQSALPSAQTSVTEEKDGKVSTNIHIKGEELQRLIEGAKK